jgi:hypothetical protein
MENLQSNNDVCGRKITMQRMLLNKNSHATPKTPPHHTFGAGNWGKMAHRLQMATVLCWEIHGPPELSSVFARNSDI